MSLAVSVILGIPKIIKILEVFGESGHVKYSRFSEDSKKSKVLECSGFAIVEILKIV